MVRGMGSVLEPVQMLAMAGVIAAAARVRAVRPRALVTLAVVGAVATLVRAAVDPSARFAAAFGLLATAVLAGTIERRGAKPTAHLSVPEPVALLPWATALLDGDGLVAAVAWMAAGVHARGSWLGPHPLLRVVVAVAALFALLGKTGLPEWAARAAMLSLGLLMLLDAWPDGHADRRSVGERLGRLFLATQTLFALAASVHAAQGIENLFPVALTPAAFGLFLMAASRAARSDGVGAELVDAFVAACGGLLVAAAIVCGALAPFTPFTGMGGADDAVFLWLAVAATLPPLGCVGLARSPRRGRIGLLLAMTTLPPGLAWWMVLPSVLTLPQTGVYLPRPEISRVGLLVAMFVFGGPLTLVPALFRAWQRPPGGGEPSTGNEASSLGTTAAVDPDDAKKPAAAETDAGS